MDKTNEVKKQGNKKGNPTPRDIETFMIVGLVIGLAIFLGYSLLKEPIVPTVPGETPVQQFPGAKLENTIRHELKKYVPKEISKQGCNLSIESASIAVFYFDNLEPDKFLCLSFDGKDNETLFDCKKIEEQFKEKLALEEAYLAASCQEVNSSLLISYNASEGVDNIKLEVKSKDFIEKIIK
jgi:hypothetical protein